MNSDLIYAAKAVNLTNGPTVVSIAAAPEERDQLCERNGFDPHSAPGAA